MLNTSPANADVTTHDSAEAEANGCSAAGAGGAAESQHVTSLKSPEAANRPSVSPESPSSPTDHPTGSGASVAEHVTELQKNLSEDFSRKMQVCLFLETCLKIRAISLTLSSFYYSKLIAVFKMIFSFQLDLIINYLRKTTGN